jgi:hypothetical protein
MKKIAVFWSVLLLGLFLNLNAAVVEVKDEADLYKNEKREMNEKKLYTANKGEQLTVIDDAKDLYKVRTMSGIEGWVRKSLVKSVADASKAKSSMFKMDEAKVQGYLDNPQAVYILDMADPSFKPIKLDRSFADNLSGNIDKETNQRANDPSLKPNVVSEK